MTLVKDIVPVDEQLGDPGKFDLHIDGEGAYDASKDEAGDGDSVVARRSRPATVDLAETADDETRPRRLHQHATPAPTWRRTTPTTR